MQKSLIETGFNQFRLNQDFAQNKILYRKFLVATRIYAEKFLVDTRFYEHRLFIRFRACRSLNCIQNT